MLRVAEDLLKTFFFNKKAIRSAKTSGSSKREGGSWSRIAEKFGNMWIQRIYQDRRYTMGDSLGGEVFGHALGQESTISQRMVPTEFQPDQ